MVLLACLVIGANVVLNLRTSAEDRTAPELTVPMDVLELSVEAEESEYLTGVQAKDSRDGDLTDQVFVEHTSQLTGADTIEATYAVFDEAGNFSKATRTIRYTDYSGPYFTLSEPLRFPVGAVVTLKDRLMAVDQLDGEITGNIRMTNISLSNDIEGIYRIRVQVTNSLGDTETLTLPVIIIAQPEITPTISLSEYIVYTKAGDSFVPEDYINGVSDPASDSFPQKTDVAVETTAVLNTPGTYDVVYTYTGVKATGTVILTLVVTG